MIIDINAGGGMSKSLREDEAFFREYLRCIPRAYGKHVEVKDVPGMKEKAVYISEPKGYDNVGGMVKA